MTKNTKTSIWYEKVKSHISSLLKQHEYYTDHLLHLLHCHEDEEGRKG